MYRLLQIYLVILMIPAVISCGRGSSGDKDAKSIRTPTPPKLVGTGGPTDEEGISFQNMPVSYGFADEACQTANEPQQIHTGLSYHSWNGVERQTVSQQLTSIRSDNGLRGEIVEATLVGTIIKEDIVATLDPSTGILIESETSGLPELQVVGETLKICPSSAKMPYPLDSYEGVALSSLNFIESAYQYYQRLSESQPLKQITLAILPVWKRIYRVPNDSELEQDEDIYGFYKTDNAAYAGGLGDGIIFILPQEDREFSASDRDLFGSPLFRMWESDFIVSHEFGHHVFQSLLLQALNSSGDAFSSAFDHSHTIRSQTRSIPRPSKGVRSTWEALDQRPYQLIAQSEAAMLPEDVPLGRPLAAVNEAFADLFAFYKLEANNVAHYVDTIPFLSGDREILLDHFEDGSPKVLGKTELITFFRQERRLSAAVDFANVHIIGAILAHGFDQLLLAHLDEIGPMLARPKGIYLFEVLRKHLGDSLVNVESMLGEQSFDGAAFLAGSLHAMTQGFVVDGSLSRRKCDVLLEVFPALVSPGAGAITIGLRDVNETFLCQP